MGKNVWMAIALLAVVSFICPASLMAQQELFFDDFSGDLSKWQELGNAGTPMIQEGELLLEWGHEPNWFVTDDSFNFGSEPLQVDFTFVGGGFQASSNFKRNLIQPLLGVTDVESADGSVRVLFSADFFNMDRRVETEAGDLSWEAISFAGGAPTLSIEPGVHVRFEIDETAQQGKMFIDGEEALSFLTQPVMSGGFGFRVVTGTRNIIVDDVYVSQIDGSGNETVVLDDDFERADLGADWVNETLGTITAPSALDAYIENGQLVLVNDGSADAWLRTNAQLEFAGKKTVFEYTFVDFVEGSAYLPSPVLGVKPYESGVTNGVILVDAGSSFNFGMVNGGWAGGQGSLLGGNRPGMRFKIVVNPGGQSAVVFRDGIEALDFLNIGPAFSGSFAFRTIVDRDAVIDDVRVYTIENDGSETTLFEDDFNRDEVGDDWITESITPDVPPGAQWALLEDRDGDGDNELFLDHDSSADDAWFRLIKDLPFEGDKPVVIEGTYVDFAGNPAIAIGAVQWIANETVGPILLDNLVTPWVMDTREGNVWVRPGAVGGSVISLKVNADARSGSFLVNEIKIRDWEFAEGEAPIPAGAIGFEDPFTTPQQNTSPPAVAGTFANARYDDVRVTKLETSSVHDWMIQ